MAVAQTLPPTCASEECERLAWDGGLCGQHRPPPGLRVCRVEGCGGAYYATWLCAKHYKRRYMRRRRAQTTQETAENLRRAAAADARLWLERVWSQALLEVT